MATLTHQVNDTEVAQQMTDTAIITYGDHNFGSLGSLASPCQDCGLEFAMAVSCHRVNWPGHECSNYTRSERIAIEISYVKTVDAHKGQWYN